MKAYNLKYWATDGVRIVEGEVLDSGSFMIHHPGGQFQALTKNEYTLTLEGAKKKVEQLRKKKIESLTKQIEKLNNLRICWIE